MRLFYWITLFTSFNINSQNLETNLSDSLPQKPVSKILDKINQEIGDSISVIIKSKEDLILNDSLKQLIKKKREIRYRNIFMDSVLIRNYRIYNDDESFTYVDTTLTIEKDYRFNYLRKDYFEYLTFPNMGEAYNKMGYDFTKKSLFLL